MKKFFKIRSEIFGLEINDLSLKIIKLKEKKGSFVLASINEADIKAGIIENGVIKDENALAEIIKKACKNVKGESLDTKYVVASLPEERAFLQVIKMPEMPEKEIKAAAFFEVENYIPLSIDNIYVDFQKITPEKEHAGNADVLIVAMPKQIVDSYVSCLKKADLIPFILEVESQATARALIKKETGGPLAIIDLGKNNASLIIFSGNCIRFTCSINIGSDKFSDLSSKASKAVADDLLLQVKKYLDFYVEHFFHEQEQTGGKVEKIILCGDGANLKGLSDFFAKSLSIPAEVAGLPPDIMPKNKNKDRAYDILKNSASYMVALGLAERGAVEGKGYPHI